MKGIGGMDLFDIEAKTEQALALLDEVTDSIKPMIMEEFKRDDPMLAAWNLIGASRGSIRLGRSFFRQAVKEMKGGDDRDGMGPNVVR